MKIADFIKLVTTVLLPNPLPGLANYLLWNRLIGRGTANCPNIFAGDPVNVVSGNFYLTRRDITIPSRGMAIEITDITTPWIIRQVCSVKDGNRL